MKLSQDLQPHFPHAALIIASDSVIAKFFLVGGDDLEELDGVAEPREERPDSEGKFSDEPNEAARLQKFIKKMAEQAERLVREHAIAHIHLVMPSEIEHALRKELAHDINAKVMHVRHADLMKEDPLTIVRRVVEL